MDRQIADAERSLAEARETRQRAEEAAHKRATADQIEAERSRFNTALRDYQATLQAAGGEGPGLAEMLEQFVVVEGNALKPMIYELRHAANLLSDPNISAKQLRQHGVWSMLPSSEPPPPPIADARAHVRYMDPAADVPHSYFPLSGQPASKLDKEIAAAGEKFPATIGKPRTGSIVVERK